MKKTISLPAFALTIFLTSGAAYADGDSANGAELFQHHCGACHSLTANRVGPILSGAYGRKAGSVPGFTYSEAVKSSGVTWDSASLDKWLTNPRDFIPGQRMNFSVSDPQKRADIIAYLKKASEPGK
jgi:cytochrome c